MKNLILIFTLLFGLLSSQITFAVAEKSYQQINNRLDIDNKPRKISYLEKRLIKKACKIAKITYKSYANYDAIGALLVIGIAIFVILAGIIAFGIPLALLGVNFWLGSLLGMLVIYLLIHLLIH